MPVESISTLIGDHCCTNTAGYGVVNAALGLVTYEGVSINNVNDYIRILTKAGAKIT
jgi:hypothetical protein